MSHFLVLYLSVPDLKTTNFTEVSRLSCHTLRVHIIPQKLLQNLSYAIFVGSFGKTFTPSKQ